jgi:hypothetical protein
MRRSVFVLIGLLIARCLFAQRLPKIDLLQRLRQAGF